MREVFVRKSSELWQHNSMHDDTWTPERVETMYAEAFEATQKGIFEGHSQRDWL